MPKWLDGSPNVIGLVIIAAYAWIHFDPDAEHRGTTTHVRFVINRFLYVLSITTVYLAILASPQLVKLMIPLLGGLNDDVLASVQKTLPPPYVAVILLTVLIPSIPGRSGTILRGFFHRMALIPHTVMGLAAMLPDLAYEVPDAARQRLAQRLRQQGLRLTQPRIEAMADSLNARWGRCVALMVVLQDIEKDPQYQQFKSTRMESFTKLQTRHGFLAGRVKRWLLARQRLSRPEIAGTDALDRHTRDVLSSVMDDTEDEVEAHLHALCRYIARATFWLNPSPSGRDRFLARFGFQVPREPASGLQLNALTMLFVTCLAVMLAALTISNQLQDSPGPLLAELARAPSVALIITLSIICALTPRRWNKDFRWGGDGLRPVHFYVLAGVLAALAWAAVMSLHSALPIAPPLLETLQTKWPFALLAFVTALMTAIAADNRPPEASNGAAPGRWTMRLRCVESIAQGLVTAATAAGVCFLLPMVGGESPHPAVLIGTGFVLGALLGWFVPTAYRAREEFVRQAVEQDRKVRMAKARRDRERAERYSELPSTDEDDGESPAPPGGTAAKPLQEGERDQDVGENEAAPGRS